ncbi:MAG TPA: BTAD domain-containing putative transcriptional regulator, partial [Roseateles sp.]|nr:BTAD domain-containing putative transcriptional regulator [Roseateles sp.]
MSTNQTAAVQPPSLHLLGGFELLDAGGRPLTLPYDKARALLAMLCLHSGALEREPLAELLWPDSAPPQARANLRRALFDLRRCLARLWPNPTTEALHADKKRVQLREALPWRIDCREFSLAQQDAATPASKARLSALQRAVALYRGPLLDGLSLEDAPGFEAWLAPRRETLQRQALQSLATLAELLEQQGEMAEALACARRSMSLDPWCEQALRCCMRVLAPQQPAQALALFEQFSEQLQRELGLSPQSETQALALCLRRPPAPPAAAPAAQRRRVVALACEWEATSSATDSDHDAEALSTQLPRWLEWARSILQAQGAWVQRAEGGELLAFFGHPRALEQAPRLALDSALALMVPAEDGAALTPRLGLHVDWVHSLPDQASPDSVGTLSRKARRLALLARPGTARVSAELRQQSLRHHRFLVAEADGSSELRDAPRGSARLANLQPMVGRDTDLAQLLDHWSMAQRLPRAIWIQGEPGLGKTRLLQALRREIATSSDGAAVRLLQLQCRPEFRHSPWHPVVAALQRSLGPLEDLRRAQAALQHLLQQAGLDPATDLES